MEDVFVRLAVGDRRLTAEEGVRASTVEEAGCVVEEIALDVGIGIGAVAETNMLLEFVTACVFFGGSDIS